MKLLKKTLAYLMVFLVIFIIGFYFWAQRTIYPLENYSKTIQFSDLKNIPLPDTFSLMTYNIGYLCGMTNNLAVERPEELFASNLTFAKKLFEKTSPDIIAFQEIDFHSSRSYFVNQHQELGELGAFSNGATVINWDKQYVPFPYWPMKYHFGEMLSGQAILSHAKIVSNERIVLPKPKSNPFYYDAFYLDRLAQLIWIETLEDSLLVINVHFEAWDGPTRELQSEIVLEIFEKFEDDYPIILTGDFNCTPPYSHHAYNEKTIDVLLSYPSLSAAITKESYTQGPDKYYSFNSENPSEKIDYIFYNNKFLKCLEAEVIHPSEEISDHLPVFASFVIKH